MSLYDNGHFLMQLLENISLDENCWANIINDLYLAIASPEWLIFSIEI